MLQAEIMYQRLDPMARLSCKVIMTAAAVGAPEIIVYNDSEHSVIKVAHVSDCRPFIIGDYATLEDAASQFSKDCSALTALALDRRPEAIWYKRAVSTLMHINLAPVFRSIMIQGATRGSVYTVVYINSVWRLTTPSGIWMKVNSELL